MTPQDARRPPLALWGGIECTVNRVGDHYFDQIASSGHGVRLDDLDRIAALGIRTLRYPVLWERAAPDHPEALDWSWTDLRLRRLRELGVDVIAGLVHHGSGPRFTSLVEPSFADGLANYARRVAQRYPWLNQYTPVNEPLTTARFAGLYGHWHPHGRDGLTFARALLMQCRAVVLAMRAIRQVRPDARLVQTDDLGRTQSTPALRYQAEFENQRRWLTFDLLAGRVDHGHPVAHFFRWLGVPERELAWFCDNPCPPDVLGINYYLTSERFLDERLERYPPAVHGGNGRHAYADVEAVRVCGQCGGLRSLLGEVWARYGMPIAITEAHLGCTREEQLRWLLDVWRAATAVRRTGADVRAVTIWSLLGACDWDCLVTQQRGHYEPGAFDVRSPVPRPTALAALAAELAAGCRPTHPVLRVPGWWRRPERRGDPLEGEPARDTLPRRGRPRARPLLITGATGTLGRAFAQGCTARGLPFRLLTRGEMDIANRAAVTAALEECEPWAVVNAAGYVRVDHAEREPDVCYRENTVGPAVLATACAPRDVALLTFSSDLVFDGSSSSPYSEGNAVNPLNVYGRSKAEAERELRRLYPEALVVRTAAFFGPWDAYNFVTIALRELAAGRRFSAADDLVVSPTYVPDLIHAALDLLIDAEHGVWHLVNRGATTWAELARVAARGAGLDETLVEPCPASAFGWPAPRPRYCPLVSERGQLLPALEDALARYLRERQPVVAAPADDRAGLPARVLGKGARGLQERKWARLRPR